MAILLPTVDQTTYVLNYAATHIMISQGIIDDLLSRTSEENREFERGFLSTRQMGGSYTKELPTEGHFIVFSSRRLDR